MSEESVLKKDDVENIILKKMRDTLTKDDIPAGAPLARQLAFNFGDIGLIDETGENFVWGVSIWGRARIGN